MPSTMVVFRLVTSHFTDSRPAPRSMQFASLQRFFDRSPAMHLLRSPYAPWIVAFLHQQFKSSGQITWLHSPLAAQLEITLLELQSESSGAPPTRLSSGAYLNHWSSGDCRWLKRFIDEFHSEPVYQLTPDAELVLAFVSKATRTATFIGTQSHFCLLYTSPSPRD